MKIEFKKLHIENFMSLGNADIELNDRGYCVVSGINNNPSDAAKSNGSGKSTIFEAIVWSLTGNTMRGNKDIVNCFANDGALVELTFIVDKDIYKIIRTKDHSKYKTNLLIYINDEDHSGKGIRDSEKLLKDYLPELTADLIGSVIILGQGLPNRFTNNSPSGRKEVLEKLCKSDFMIEDLKNRITTRRNCLQDDLRTNEDNLLRTNTKLDIDKHNLEIQRATLNDLLNQPDYTDSINQLQETLTLYSTKAKELDIEHDALSNKLPDLVGKQRNCSESKNEELYAVELNYKEHIAALQANVNNIDVDIRTLQGQIRTAENMKDICPTCGQKLPDVHKPDCTEWKKQLEVKQTEKINFTNRLQELQAQQEADKTVIRDKYVSIEQSINVEYQQVIKEQKEKKAEFNKISAEYAAYEKQLNDLVLKVQTKQQNIDNCNAVIQQLTDSILAANDSITLVNSYIENIKERLSVISKFNTVVTRDFRGYLLESVIVFIDNKLKEYAKKMFDTELISFKLDGNNISISYNNKEYEALSGGERQKLDLLIQFAIREMLCTYTNFNTNILALDEIFDALDSIGSSKVIDFISTQLSDISSIFVISHHSNELSIPNDDEIIVVKEADGISYIK